MSDKHLRFLRLLPPASSGYMWNHAGAALATAKVNVCLVRFCAACQVRVAPTPLTHNLVINDTACCNCSFLIFV